MILHLYSMSQTEETLFDFYEAEPPYSKKRWCKDNEKLKTKLSAIKLKKFKRGRLKPKCRCEIYEFKHEFKRRFFIRSVFE